MPSGQGGPARGTPAARAGVLPAGPPWPDGINHLSSLLLELLVQRRANADYDASVETCEVFPGKNFGFLGPRDPRKQQSKRVYTRRDIVLFIGT